MKHARVATATIGAGPSRLAPVFSLLAVGALLGVSTNLVKVAANRGLHPLTLLTWSVAGAALVVTALAAASGRTPQRDRRRLEYYGIAAAVGVVAPNLLLYAAVPRVGAGFVALSMAFPPLLTYVGALALGMERFDKGRAAGVGIALAGATTMAYLKASAPEAPLAWIAATMLAPVILAAGNLYRTARWPDGATPDELAPGVLLAAAGMLLGLGAANDVPLGPGGLDPAATLLIALQAAVLSAQYALYFVLQKQGGPVLMSLIGSVAAVFGVPVAVFLIGEPAPAGLALGGLAIAAGIALLVGRAAGGPRER
ncbi:MAG TPA: DMT family transporter [Candidatus Krumholzibacteria bacterium]|nr:DMT family transporter [Candidatus Krumholzibacteria bacterium]